VVEAFVSTAEEIDSAKYQLQSNEVLQRVAPGLRAVGFAVEAGKHSGEKISVPVLFGLNAKAEKTFDADAFHQG
jgi:hypothetical protein